MEVFYELNNRNKNLAIALGFFDGIHLGHQAVLNSAVKYAKENNIKSAVITFENHPKCFFKNCEPEYILSKQEKLKIFEELGFDFVYFIKFDLEIAKLSADKYLKLLSENLSPKAIFTGFNHTFGSNKKGDCDFLEQKAKIYNYKYFKINPVEINNEIVSSSVIRNNLKLGNIKLVNKMLARRYSLTETVVEGEKIGRTIGFRTANLIYPKHLLNIGRGVYSVEVEYNSNIYRGVANFGMRPSLGNTKIPILEVHILDFNKDIYGEKIKVYFEKKIRDEKKFNSLDELKERIEQDVKEAK